MDLMLGFDAKEQSEQTVIRALNARAKWSGCPSLPNCRVISAVILAVAMQIILAGQSFIRAADAKQNDSAAQSETAEQDKTPATKPETSTNVRGTISQANGSPAAQVVVQAIYRGKRQSSVQTDDNGRFEIPIEKNELRGLTLLAHTSDFALQAIHKLEWHAAELEAEKELHLTLAPAQEIVVHVKHELQPAPEAAESPSKQTEPVAGATVAMIADYSEVALAETTASGEVMLKFPAGVEVDAIFAVKRGVGLDYRCYRARGNAKQSRKLDEHLDLVLDRGEPVTVRLTDSDNRAIAGVPLYVWYVQKPDEPEHLNLSFCPSILEEVTDAQGSITFDWIPRWQQKPLTIWPHDPRYTRRRISYDPAKDKGSVSATLDRVVSVGGHARFADGRPAANIRVVANSASYEWDEFRGTTTTDAQGHFEFNAWPEQLYMFTTDDKTWAASVVDGVIVKRDTPIDDLQLTIQRATRLFGRVTVGPDTKPVEGQDISLYQYGRDLHNLKNAQLSNSENSRRWVQPAHVRSTTTDADGRFEFLVGMGKYDLRGPTQNEIKKFEVTSESPLEHNFHAARPERGTLSGLVVTGNPPQPVAGAKISGIYRHQLAGRDLEAVTDDNGRFSVERELHSVVLHAESKDEMLIGIIEITGDDETVTLPIAPSVSAFGRIIDGESGAPLSNRKISYALRVHLGGRSDPWRNSFGGTTQTDSEGKFTLDQLVVGQNFDIDVPIGEGSSKTVGEVKPASHDPIDLGVLTLKPNYKPPTMDDRIASAFKANAKAQQSYTSALAASKESHQHVAIFFAEESADRTKDLFVSRFEDQDLRNALNDYRVLSVGTLGKNKQQALDLAKQLDIDLSKHTLPLVSLHDPAGKQLDLIDATTLFPEDKLRLKNLITVLKLHAPLPLNAEQLFTDALAQAKRENKRVLVEETATWCGPCQMLAKFLESHREIWSKDYVWIKIDHRWTHSSELMKQLHAGERGGIPFTVIVDADGKSLVTSIGPNGNVGFPSKPDEIDHFMQMLEKTAQRMTIEDRAVLRSSLQYGH